MCVFGIDDSIAIGFVIAVVTVAVFHPVHSTVSNRIDSIRFDFIFFFFIHHIDYIILLFDFFCFFVILSPVDLLPRFASIDSTFALHTLLIARLW